MRHILLLTFLLCYLANYSQAFYLNQTEELIRERNRYTITESYDSLGQKILSWDESVGKEWKEKIVVYFKGNSSICTLIIPANRSILNSEILGYNERYVKLSDSKWKAYVNGLVYNIVYIGLKNPQTSEHVDGFLITNSNE